MMNEDEVEKFRREHQWRPDFMDGWKGGFARAGAPSWVKEQNEQIRALISEIDHVFVYGVHACPVNEPIGFWRCIVCQVPNIA